MSKISEHIRTSFAKADDVRDEGNYRNDTAFRFLRTIDIQRLPFLICPI